MPTGRAERALPLRTPIEIGESMDGWLERLALRTGVPLKRLLPILGQPMRRPSWRLIHDLPPDGLRRIERQTGLSAGRLDTAIPARYAPLGWPRRLRSRYCPGCLTEHGRWQLIWQLPWAFACPGHRLLLADQCPGCSAPLRRRISELTGMHPPTVCTVRIAPGRFCLADLATVDVEQLSAGDPRLHAQEWINARLADSQSATTAVDDLRDLEAVGAWIRWQAAPADFAREGAAVVAAFAEYVSTRRAHQPTRHAFTDPRIVAAVAVRAVDLLSAHDPDDIRRHLQPVIAGRSDRATGQQPPLAIKRNRWQTLTPGRQAILLSAVDPELGPLDRLRYRTGTAQPGIACEPDVAAARVRHLPQQLWPDWIVRLAVARIRPAQHLAVAAPCCLLVPASTQYPIGAAMAGLRTRQAVASATVWLATLHEPHQSAVVAVLCRIAAYLDEHGSPINYQRRRQMISTSLLTWPQWEQLCFQANTHPGLQHRIRHARRYLYQLLTGADLAEDHGALTLPDGAELTSYRAFTDWLPSQLRHALHGFAAEYLQRLGIDEPVTWSPPASCAAGLALPGREPRDIDLDAVARLLTEQNSFRVIARRLGASYDHVRYAAHHLITTPESAAAPNSPQAAHQLRERARELFTPAFLQWECLNAGKSLLQLEAETGIHRKLIAEYTRHAGIPTPANRRRTHIDETWLREQHLNQRRSLTAIAADLGVAHPTVFRAAHHYGIPVRRQGGRRSARRPT